MALEPNCRGRGGVSQMKVGRAGKPDLQRERGITEVIRIAGLTLVDTGRPILVPHLPKLTEKAISRARTDPHTASLISERGRGWLKDAGLRPRTKVRFLVLPGSRAGGVGGEAR